MTRASRLTVAVLGLTVVLVVVHTWFFFGWHEVRREPGWPVLPVGALLMGSLGALIVTRLPGHRIGWLFVAAGICVASSDVLGVYAVVLEAEDLGLPRAADIVLSWLRIFFDLPAPSLLLTLTFLLFPDGRLPSRRWRPALWATWATFIGFVVIVLIAVRPEMLTVEDPVDVPGWATASYAVLGVSVLVEALTAAVSTFVRLRRGTSEERRQLGAMMVAAFAVTLAFALSLFGELAGLNGVAGTWVRVTPLHLAVVAVPISAGLAILRHQLYGIDVLLNRAIVLTGLTVFVATGYIAVVVLIGGAMGERAQERFWPSLLAFVLVAVAFQPARRYLLRAAHRLVYGRRAAPYEALADFSSRAARAPSTELLLPLIAETVGRSLGARRASVALEVEECEDVTLREAAYPVGTRVTGDPGPAPEGSDVIVEVRDHDERVGQLRLQVELPLTPAQRRLAEDMAGQAAIALRNLRLQAQLAARVEQVSQQAAALEVSRRRLLAARDDERSRLARALGREVVSRLESMPADLASLATSGDRGRVESRLEEHIEAASLALEELRAISRGLVPRQPTHR